MITIKNIIQIMLSVSFILMTSMDAYANYPSDLDDWCKSRIRVKVASGQGKVYAAYAAEGTTVTQNQCTDTIFTTACGRTKSQNNRPCKFFITAKADEGYEFDYWECVQNKGQYDTNSNYANGKKTNLVGDKLYMNNSEEGLGGYWVVYAALSLETDTTINAVWDAHFKPITTQLVKVESENTALGTTTINKANNDIGYEVTITANCKNEKTMFKGWYKLNLENGQKEFVTKTNPYTFTINNNNKGNYYARFEGGYDFLRVKNDGFGHYLKAKALYSDSVTNLTQLSTALSTQLGLSNSLETAIIDEGTMMKVYVSGHQQNTGKPIWDFYVQNEHTSKYYDPTPGVARFVVVNHYADNSYLVQSSSGDSYLVEFNNGLRVVDGMPENRSANWQFEGMDKDLTTKENYFAVDPSEFIGPDNDGNYWTTLRVCFNMMYETSEITPYIVTSANANTGEMTIIEVTGGIIPEKTCVLLKCKSTDVTRNVMIPTTTAASFSPTGNLLQSSTYYYKNQSVSSSLNLKGIKLVDGRIGFGGATKTSVDGNRAYLSIASDVSIIPPYISTTLADLCRNGRINGKYVIEEPLLAVYGMDNKLWLKDADGSSISKTEPAEGDKNYEIVTSSNTRPNQAEYDQSNWLEVQLPSTADATIFDGRMIKANAIKGQFTNKTNPTMTGVPLAESDITTETLTSTINYAPNYYCTANFEGSQNGVTGNTTAHYFFMNPKPQEYAMIMWAKYVGNNKMEMPSEGNGHGFTGEFNIDLSLNPAYTPVQNNVYNFQAIVRKNGSKSNNYLVFPLDLSEDVITAVADVKAKQVAGVKYYNLAGIESDQPFDGVNIVVTTYTDGSRSSSKVLR